ncbi:MAG: TolC family protein, partial [Candidatus Omnitrophota bacterium]
MRTEQHKQERIADMLVKKSIRAGVALFLFVFFNMPYASCSIGSTGPVVFLTLEKTIAIAFLNNKNIQIQQREINVARANILEGWSRFFPKVSADTAYTYNNGSLNQDLVQPKYAKKDIGVFTGYKNDNKLVGIIKETLYDGGANVANLKQSELDLKVQDETLRAKKLDVEFEAKRLYYGLLLAYETEHVVRNFLRQAEEHYENVKNKHEQGTVSRFQLLQAKVRVSNVIPSLVEAVNAVELIKDDLKKLLSLGIWDQIEAEGRLAYSPIEVNELLFLEEANRNRPEIILSELGVNISKWSIELARSGYLPTITGDATYLFRSDYLNNIFTPKHNNWTVGGQVSFPVF